MGYGKCWAWALLWIWACGDKAAPPAAPAEPPAAAPAPPAPRPSSPSEPNPCDKPGLITLELEAGVSQQTPWNLEFKYVVDDDKKLGPGYLFQLRSGERRWETRRDDRNWTSQLTWRGYCWRGGERPARRSLRLQIQIAPVCKDGKLQELGGCGNALASG